MPGITHRVSTSSFKPLSLNEIMMVPLAKRKMEDEFLANTDKINELEASTLAGDSEEAQAILNQMKERASNLSNEILKKGFSRGQMNMLRGLKSEVTKEYGSQGFLGNAIANKKAAAKYSEFLMKSKDNRGGYSAAEAQQWANSQLKGFKTRAEDGSFNSFSGKHIHDRYDYDKFLKDAADNVESDKSPLFEGGLSVLKNQGLPAFKQLYLSGGIEKKSFNKIMSSIVNQAKGNPDLLKSLQQEAFFTGEKTPLDLGRLSDFKRDENGKAIPGSREWIVGDSFFGRRIAGVAQGASFVKPDIKQNIITDELQMKLQSEGLNARDVGATISFLNGKLEETQNESLESVENGLKIVEEKLSEYKQLLDSYPEEEKAIVTKDGKTIVKRDYERLQNLYARSLSKAHNARNNIKNAKKEAISQVSDSNKKLYDLSEKISKSGDWMDYAFEKGLITKQQYNAANAPISSEARHEMTKISRGGIYDKTELPSEVKKLEKYRKEIRQLVLNNEGMSQYKSIDVRKAKKLVENKASQELVSNPQKYQVKLLVGNKGTIAETNKTLTDNFNLGSYSYAYDKKQTLEEMRDSLENEKGTNKIGVKVVSTSSLNPDGYPIEQVTFFNKETGVDLKVTSATRGYDGMVDFLRNAKSLSGSSDPLLQERGMKMYVNAKVMPALISSGVNQEFQKKGKISNWTVKFDGKDVSLGWVKEIAPSGDEVIKITAGEHVFPNQFFTEQELANAIYERLPK